MCHCDRQHNTLVQTLMSLKGERLSSNFFKLICGTKTSCWILGCTLKFFKLLRHFCSFPRKNIKMFAVLLGYFANFKTWYVGIHNYSFYAHWSGSWVVCGSSTLTWTIPCLLLGTCPCNDITQRFTRLTGPQWMACRACMHPKTCWLNKQAYQGWFCCHFKWSKTEK